MFTLPTLGDTHSPELKSYLYQLTDQLKFALSHIDRENISGELLKQYENTVTVSESLSKINEAVENLNGRSEKTAASLAGSIADQKDELEKACEDLRNAIAKEAEEVTNEYTSAIEKNNESFSASFLESEELANKLNSVKTDWESTFLQTAKEMMMIFSQEYEGETPFSDFAATFKRYIRFSQEGIEIGEDGENGSRIVARLSNDRLSFLQKGGSGKGYEIAYLSGKKLYITEAQVLSVLTLGMTDHGVFYDLKTDPSFGLVLTAREG